MEDIIFNGSEARKPVGMAEVVLTFSNDRGKAPSRYASFSEIEVARRLYRSGESEYYINKVRCRLRDIVDLFTDTGIGKEGYSIVEQGQVSWLVNARPEERRVLFEEAAGINRFKHKRDTALRRLDATRENLLRVGDIIAEVKRQLNSLNRQAKKAERYKAAREALREVDLRLCVMEHALLMEKKSGHEKKMEEAGDRLIGLGAEKAALELRREEATQELLQLEERYGAIEEKVAALEQGLGAGERQAELARLREEELIRNIERLDLEIGEMALKKDSVEAAKEETHALLEGASGSMEEAKATLQRLEGELEEILGALRDRASVEAGLKTRLVQNGARLTDLRHALEKAIDEEQRERERHARAGAGMAEAREKISAMEAPLSSLRKDMVLSTEQGKTLEEGLAVLGEKIRVLEEERDHLLAEAEALREARAASRARLKTLEEMERNLENIQGGARRVLGDSTLRGVHGMVADFMEANKGYEKAVEAALGERLEYIIVEGQGEGIEAIGFLKSNSGGRGSFVPLRDLRPAPSAVPAGLAARGMAKPLLDEIKIRDGYSSIINALLGDTLIVKDMTEALALWRTDGMFSTIVTLDGERLSPEGVLSGGELGGTEGGILQRRGEIKGIRSDLARVEARLGELTARLSDIDEGLVAANRELDEMRANLHRAEIERVNRDSELKRQEEEIEAQRRLLENLRAEQAEAESALRRIEDRKRELVAERAALEEAVKEDEEELRRILAGTAAIEEKRSAMTGLVTASQVDLARQTERREALETRLCEQEALLEELDQRIGARKREKSLAEQGVEEKRTEVREVEERLKGLYGELGELRSRSREEKENLAKMQDRIKAMDQDLAALGEKTRKIEEERGALGFMVREIDLKIANLDEKLTEKYGLGLAELPEAVSQGGEVSSGEEGAEDMAVLRARRDELQAKIHAMGEVSLSALEEYRELEERHTFLLAQQEDLTRSMEGLMKAIARINRQSRARLRSAFDEISARFKKIFPQFFRGGHAELRLTDESNILESGIEIVAQPPGKKLQNISLLSGGEKALTAVSLIFSIFLIKPSPFCLLDEVDAPLDEANIDRFNAFVREISDISQFILITHNKRTMEVVDRLYGVTMEEPGVSKIVSVKF